MASCTLRAPEEKSRPWQNARILARARQCAKAYLTSRVDGALTGARLVPRRDRTRRWLCRSVWTLSKPRAWKKPKKFIKFYTVIVIKDWFLWSWNGRDLFYGALTLDANIASHSAICSIHVDKIFGESCMYIFSCNKDFETYQYAATKRFLRMLEITYIKVSSSWFEVPFMHSNTRTFIWS